MKKKLLIFLALISTSTFASTVCFEKICAEKVIVEGNIVTLISPTLGGYQVKPKKVFRKAICKALDATYLDHKVTIATVYEVGTDLDPGLIIGINGVGAFKSRILSKLMCTLNPNAGITVQE